jgi:nucleotide-binding universal stress UspA family protein
LSDLIIAKRPVGSDVTAERIFDAAVFGTGRPTLVIPEELPDHLLRHVIVAWDGSLEGARAVAGATTLLREASAVSIFTAGQDGDDEVTQAGLAEALRWHGITARPLMAREADERVGPALLAAVVEQNATMLVMGAYTHSRLRQAFLGGLTRYVLGHIPIPVLMAH